MHKSLIAVLGALVLTATSAVAQAPEKPALEQKDIKLGVGGKPSLYYLTLTLAERLGYFKEQGLDVEINDFAGGAKALQSLVGGSVDMVTGAYEHTIRMQAKGQDVRALIELGRYPAISVLVRKDKAAAYKSPADLKGMKIGVTAPGSSTQMIVQYMLASAGLKAEDVSFVGVGASATAVAAMRKGEIDALANIEPVVSKLEKDGDAVIVAETRSTEGTTKLLGGAMPAAVLYAKGDFIDKNPNTVQALTNAFYKTVKWMEKATAEQIADTVPDDYHLGDKALYIAALKASISAYSKDGIVSADGQTRSLEFLQKFEPELKDAKIDLAKTFDGRFMKKAAEAIK
jgi:NitT/TauT family transport system substrate-binding protein